MSFLLYELRSNVMRFHLSFINSILWRWFTPVFLIRVELTRFRIWLFRKPDLYPSAKKNQIPKKTDPDPTLENQPRAGAKLFPNSNPTWIRTRPNSKYESKFDQHTRIRTKTESTLSLFAVIKIDKFVLNHFDSRTNLQRRSKIMNWYSLTLPWLNDFI